VVVPLVGEAVPSPNLPPASDYRSAFLRQQLHCNDKKRNESKTQPQDEEDFE